MAIRRDADTINANRVEQKLISGVGTKAIEREYYQDQGNFGKKNSSGSYSTSTVASKETDWFLWGMVGSGIILISIWFYQTKIKKK